MILLMAAHPEVQERVQQELDEVVGPSRVPSIEDRARLVYTDATVHEMMRFIALAPLSVPHGATADTGFRGYFISQGTVVFINLYSMSHDPAVWGDPEVFRPDRFIDTSGHIKNKLLEEFLPFSIGRRRCFGEALARTEVFLFFAGIIQRCTVIKPPEVDKYDLDGEVTLTRVPTPFTVQIITRL
jgi:cytochrome P450